jgi:hypothetical protein
MSLARCVLTAENRSMFPRVRDDLIRLDDELVLSCPGLHRYLGPEPVVGIRPEGMGDAATGGGSPATDCTIAANFELREVLGSESFVHFTLDVPPVDMEDVKDLAADTDLAAIDDLRDLATSQTTRFVARMPPGSEVREGDDGRIVVNIGALHLFHREYGDAIYD